MPLALYDATVTIYLQILPAMADLIDKAEAHCRAHDLPDSALLDVRLAPDMWHLARQFHVVCIHSATAVTGAIAGEVLLDTRPAHNDFAGLRAQVNAAIATLRTITPEQLEEASGRDAAYVISPTRRMEFTAQNYLLSLAMPNFMFHATTAYDILRAQGLSIGKIDFLGALPLKV